MLKTFLETILYKTFQLFRRILIDVNSLTKSSSLQYSFQSREHVKTQMEPGLESMGDTLGHIVLC